MFIGCFNIHRTPGLERRFRQEKDMLGDVDCVDVRPWRPQLHNHVVDLFYWISLLEFDYYINRQLWCMMIGSCKLQ